MGVFFSLLLITPLPMSSRFSYHVSASGDIFFIVVVHVSDWWLWCSSHCCSFAFAQVCRHLFDLDDKAILLILIVFLLL
jgi:uncharacterized phage infection (PIP) family protein YhgE